MNSLLDNIFSTPLNSKTGSNSKQSKKIFQNERDSGPELRFKIGSASIFSAPSQQINCAGVLCTENRM